MESTSHPRIGRPAAFNPERATAAIAATAAGHTRRAVAQAAGVAAATLFSWLALGERPDAPAEYSDFLERMHAAEAQAEKEIIDVILNDARSGNWRSAAWIAEKRFRNEWASKRLVEIESAQAKTQGAAIDETIREANAAADAMMSIPLWIDKPVETWPPEVRAAAGM
jgi:transposase